MPISHERTVELCAIVGDREQAPEARRAAADEVVREHMGIAWKALERLGRKSDDELIQAARLGLWYAAERYDPRRARWSTFAHRVVRQFVVRAMKQRQSGGAESLPDARFLPESEPAQPPAQLPGGLLDALPAEQRRLLVAMYAGAKRRTLADVAADLGVSRHRAARLHREAIEALRASAYEQADGVDV